MIYQWKSNAQVKVAAQVAGEMCAQLEQTGGLTPKRLLDANRTEDAPLHKAFEWDDNAAAEAYRENQASHIIRCVTIKSETEKAEPIRAFYNITRSEHEYISLKVVLENTDMMDALLTQAKRDMQTFKAKYSQLTELAAVISTIDKYLAS